MPPRTPTRRGEPSLRVKLFQSSYDTLHFRADKLAFADPGSDDITSVTLDLTQVFEGDSAESARGTPPIRFRIIRWEVLPFVGRNGNYEEGTRNHRLHQLGVPFYDRTTRTRETRDVAYVRATWSVHYPPMEESEKRNKVLYRDGTIDLYHEGNMVPVTKGHVGDFLKCHADIQTGDPFADPFVTPFKYTLCIPTLKGGSQNVNMDITGKFSEDLIMDVTALDNSYALKFTLTLPIEDKHTQGTLEVRSRGLAYSVAEFPYLREMLFALWLVHNDEEWTYFGRWKAS